MERVAAVHFTPTFGAVEANRARLIALANEAAREARVVVLPELATTGFCLMRVDAEAWAEPLDGPTRRALAAVAKAHAAVIVCGVALREGEAYSNAALVLDADGELAGVYRKHHLYEHDFAWATAGPDAGAVIATQAGAVGVLICHDLVYPRTVVQVALARPRLLAFPTAWVEALPPGATAGASDSWVFAAHLLAPAPLVVANRGGREGDVAFGHPSAVLSAITGAAIGRGGTEAEFVWGDLPG